LGAARVRPPPPPLAAVAHPVKVGSRSGRKNARPSSIFDGRGRPVGSCTPCGPSGGGKHPGSLRRRNRSRGPPPKEGLGCVSSSPGIQAGGAACSDEWGVRAFESRPLYRCVQAGSRVTRSVRGASTGVTRGFGYGHARLTAGRSEWLAPQRIASHRGAREVREPGWCAPDSVLVAEIIEQRLAQRSHFGRGRGGRRGPSPSRETGVGEGR
jgi:hypothetical protein